MQKYLIVSLCIIATFVSIEARPWYEDDNHSTSGEDYEDEFSEHGYAEQAFDSGYRSDVAYGNRIASNSRNLGGYRSNSYGNSGSRVNGYESSRYNNDGYGSSGYGNNGYDSNGYGSNGYDSNSYGRNGYEDNGYGNNGYGNNGYGNNGYGNNGYGASVRRSNGRSNFDNGGYVPRSCPHCKINSFGNGDNNRNTFNFPKEAFN